MAVLLFFLVTLISGVWFSSYILSSGPKVPAESAVIVIPRGASVEQIGNILGEAKVIADDFRFLLLAKFSGYANRLQAGEFLMKTGQKPLEVLKSLSVARSIQHAITIPEGLNASQIAKLFSENGWCDERSFENIVYDKALMEKFGLVGLPSFEGYLYPDTYLLEKNFISAEKIVQMMIKRFFEVWQELVKEKKEFVNQKKIVILASIVEKETAAEEERPLIAGVFINRLQRGMRLQSDPTVIYGVKDFGGRITKKNLKTPTPYNTYTMKGLPLGPICNPGRKALQAVLDPLQTKALYFVAKNDGTHKFSSTLAEHNRAVRKYQRKKAKKKGK